MSDKGKSSPRSPAKSPKEAAAAGSPGGPSEAPADILPASYWREVPVEEHHEGDDDADSAFDDAQSSTASLTESILQYRNLHGRTYHSNIGHAEAWQPNDEAHSEVMDMNHHLNTLLLGDKLFLAPIPNDVQNVLDIGTGTGIWAM